MVCFKYKVQHPILHHKDFISDLSKPLFLIAEENPAAVAGTAAAPVTDAVVVTVADCFAAVSAFASVAAAAAVVKYLD